MMVAGSACCSRQIQQRLVPGCDQSAALAITRLLRTLAHCRNATIAVALREPSPELFDLFDDVLFVANGRVLYAGTRDGVRPHFRELGFEDRNGATAAFLQARWPEQLGRRAAPAAQASHRVALMPCPIEERDCTRVVGNACAKLVLTLTLTVYRAEACQRA